MIAQNIIDELLLHSNTEKAKHDQIFFKTAKGEYGEGDVFVGVPVPELRKLAKKYEDLSIPGIKKLVTNQFHEARFIALILLIARFKKEESDGRRKIAKLYLSITQYVNNWDLVDASAPYILGNFLFENISERVLLYDLAKYGSLWEQRIAIVSTLTFIRNGEFQETLRLSEMLLGHSHDLIHKAVGWMLREVGKRDRNVLEQFLQKNAPQMHRTTLRYSIEHFDNEERKRILSRKK